MNTKAKLRWREGRDGEKFPLFTGYACVLSYFSHVQLLPTPGATAHQAALAFDFPDKNSGVSYLTSRDLGDPEITAAPPALADGLFSTRTTWEAPQLVPFYAFNLRIC